MKMETLTYVRIDENSRARFWTIKIDVRNRRLTTVAGRACTDGTHKVITVKTCQCVRDLAVRRMAEQVRRGYVLVFRA